MNSIPDLQFLDFGHGAPRIGRYALAADVGFVLLLHGGHESFVGPFAWCGKPSHAPLAGTTSFVIFAGERAEHMVSSGFLPTPKPLPLSDLNAFATAFKSLLDVLNGAQGFLAPAEARWWLEELLLQLHEQSRHEQSQHEQHCETDASEAADDVESAVRRWVQEAIDNPPHALSISAIARSMGVSEVHFRRVVKKQVGVSPHRCVLERRLELAARFLRDRDEAVKAVAARHGFADVAYFTRLFTRRYGVAPAKYRRESRSSN